jgi:hypothetical protein
MFVFQPLTSDLSSYQNIVLYALFCIIKISIAVIATESQNNEVSSLVWHEKLIIIIVLIYIHGYVYLLTASVV